MDAIVLVARQNVLLAVKGAKIVPRTATPALAKNAKTDAPVRVVPQNHALQNVVNFN